MKTDSSRSPLPLILPAPFLSITSKVGYSTGLRSRISENAPVRPCLIKKAHICTQEKRTGGKARRKNPGFAETLWSRRKKIKIYCGQNKQRVTSVCGFPVLQAVKNKTFHIDVRNNKNQVDHSNWAVSSVIIFRQVIFLFLPFFRLDFFCSKQID